MSRYNVAFDVNGSVKSLQCQSVKVGNRYLQCTDETKQSDQATVAYIPFDAVEYITHDSVTVSVEFDDGDGGTTLVPSVE